MPCYSLNFSGSILKRSWKSSGLGGGSRSGGGGSVLIFIKRYECNAFKVTTTQQFPPSKFTHHWHRSRSHSASLRVKIRAKGQVAISRPFLGFQHFLNPSHCLRFRVCLTPFPSRLLNTLFPLSSPRIEPSSHSQPPTHGFLSIISQ